MVSQTNENFNFNKVLEMLNGLDSFPSMEMAKIINKAQFSLANIPFDSGVFLNHTQIENLYNESLIDFKTKNATMTFELDGEKKYFNKVTLSLSGEYSRYFPKPNYNLKIRGSDELYGRSQFKLRSDIIEPTYLRTKLVSDIHNRLGLKSISANYIQLYINEQYMGFYIITDSIKLSWIEKVYGEKNSTNLYKCKNVSYLSPDFYYGCVNENEDVNDYHEWIDFLTAVENAKSASDLEDIFDIDHFLYEMAIEYLVSGWDHIQNGHNFMLYKQPNGKWIYLSHDFDLDIGQYSVYSYNLTFEQFTKENHIIDTLILQDPSRFNEILKDVVNKVFNPSTLYPHIDELKQFIKPYVELDKTPDSEGAYPGRINLKGYPSTITMEQWDAYSEFTTGLSDRMAYGLKYWILMEYRNVCKIYNMECDQKYIDESYEYPLFKVPDADFNLGDLYPNDYPTDYPTDYYYNDIDPEPTNYYTEYDEATDIVEIYYYPENDEPTDY